MTEAIEKIRIMDCPVHNLSMDETVSLVERAVENDTQIHHVVVNAAKLVAMKTDRQLYKSVVSSGIINADGASVVTLSRLMGTPLKERVAGIDLMVRLIEMAAKKQWKVYFFGATEEVVGAVVDTYTALYGSELIAGYRNGYYKEEDEDRIARDIAQSGAQLLFVAISSPKKENFLYKYKDTLSKVNFIMGVGGSFDVIAGKVSRAPLFMQKTGLEWLYRVCQEPRRMWKRYLVTNTLFILRSIPEIIKARLHSGNSYK